MQARFIVWTAAIGSVTLVLAAMCVVVAQVPGHTRPGGPYVPPPASRRAAAAETQIAVPRTAAVRADVGSQTPTYADASAGIFESSTIGTAPARPAIVELRSGLKLDGQLASGPIPCRVMFGEASLPLETIRGIRMSEELATDEGGQARPTGATIVLENGDSLTGTPQLDSIRLRTEWGEAVVKLSHLRSLVLTSESVTWEEHEGRWRLVPVTLPQSEAADSFIPSNTVDDSSGAADLPAPSSLEEGTLPAPPAIPSEVPTPTLPPPTFQEPDAPPATPSAKS